MQNTGMQMSQSMQLIKVAAKSKTLGVAGAITSEVRAFGRAELQAVGCDAVNQAVKGVAVARQFVQKEGFDLVMQPSFADIEIEGQVRTAVRMVVERAAMAGR